MVLSAILPVMGILPTTTAMPASPYCRHVISDRAWETIPRYSFGAGQGRVLGIGQRPLMEYWFGR